MLSPRLVSKLVWARSAAGYCRARPELSADWAGARVWKVSSSIQGMLILKRKGWRVKRSYIACSSSFFKGRVNNYICSHGKPTEVKKRPGFRVGHTEARK